MTDREQRLDSLIGAAADSVVAMRRKLHRIPEIGNEEWKTAALLEAELRALGFAPECGIAGTGMTARLDFANPGPTVMIRADMDALPVREATGLDFASEHPGRMHACGHDGHMAMLLGAARVLSELAASGDGGGLCGSVLFVFQPAEETVGGATAMIGEGVMQGVDYCLAAHVWPGLPEGCVGVREGHLMAAVGCFDIRLRGRGGHGAQPHLCADVIDAAAQIVCALHHVVSRRINPLYPAVLSVGCLHAGDAFNVIPQHAVISGTTRAYHKEVRDAWEGHIRQITEGVCASFGLSWEVDFSQPTGPVDNDPYVTAVLREGAVRALGAERVLEPEPALTGEDFARFQEIAPGCLFFLGSGFDGAKPLHNPAFTFNDAILPDGVRVMCRAALALLGEKGV